jgi:hypothetical protein
MKLVCLKFSNIKKVYSVFGTTYCGVGIIEWLVDIYEFKDDADKKANSLNETLKNAGIPINIYDYSHLDLPDDFPESLAFDYYDNSGGIRYYVLEKRLK